MHYARENSVVIVRTGAITPLGLNQATTASSLKWGLSRFSRYQWPNRGSHHQFINVSKLPFLPPGSFCAERMAYLGVLAATEALQPWTYAKSNGLLSAKLPILVATPSPRPGFTQAQAEATVQNLLNQLPLNLAHEYCGIYAQGHEGGLAALGYAREMIRAGHYQACLVGGIASCLHPEYIQMLMHLNCIQNPKNMAGYIPGEAAGFLLISSLEFANRYGWSPMAQLGDVVRAQEPELWYSSGKGGGSALTAALEHLQRLRQHRGPLAELIYTDLNGAQWRNQEWGHAWAQTHGYFPRSIRRRTPARQWGDVNAATAPLLVGLCAYEMSRHMIDEQVALITASSDTSPDRAVALIHRK